MGAFKYSLSPDYIVKYWSRKNENIIGVEKEKKTTTIKEASKRNLNVGHKRGNDLSLTSKKQIIKTYLTPEEFGEIRVSADRAGLSLSTFSKKVCLGLTVPSLEHQEARLELRRLKGDLGRLGGLLKQALANGANRQTVHKLLHELDARQREVQAATARIR